MFESRTLGYVQLFEIISIDVWCPSFVVSMEGYKYYTSFIDDCSKFTWFFLLIYKSQVFEVFQSFYAFIQIHFQAVVKFFQSDSGGEYISAAFKKFLSSK